MTAATTFERHQPAVRIRQSSSRFSTEALRRGLRATGLVLLLAWGAGVLVGAVLLLGS